MADANTKTRRSAPEDEASAANKGKGRLERLDREQLHHLLYQMLLGRRLEEKAAEGYALGKIGGFCHLYIGQEAVATGALSMLRPDDYVIDAYRDHGEPKVRLEQGVQEARGVLERLPELGIRIDEVTQQLEDEGVKKFSAAFDQLMASLKEKGG